jgi:hypothetical protein
VGRYVLRPALSSARSYPHTYAFETLCIFAAGTSSCCSSARLAGSTEKD